MLSVATMKIQNHGLKRVKKYVSIAAVTSLLGIILACAIIIPLVQHHGMDALDTVLNTLVEWLLEVSKLLVRE